MPAADQLQEDIATALKGRERGRAQALRTVRAVLLDADREGRDDEVTVLRRERKRRLDAAAQYRDAGRGELADQEEWEAELIEGYLPTELSDAQLRALITRAIEQTGAQGAKDMGAVMSAVMPAVAGRADGRRVSGAVKEALA